MFKVYVVYSKSGYIGTSLIAAKDAESANEMIVAFKEQDRRNLMDALGYDFVDESDCVEDTFATHDGFLFHGINYSPR